MKEPNQNGVYEPDTTEEVARCGYSYAAIRLCHCSDGLYRYSLDVTYSYGGFSGPIFDSQDGFVSYSAAKDAALNKLIERVPKAWASNRRAFTRSCGT